jgi:hypothetical protein
MPELQDVLANNAITGMRIVHDCASDGADDEVMTGGQSYIYTCNCLGFERKSTATNLWNKATSLITDGILWAKLDIKIGFTLNSVTQEKYCKFELIIPDGISPGVDIIAETRNIFVDSQGVDALFGISGFAYVGQEVLDKGIQIRVTPQVNMTIKNKSILVVE